MQGGREGCREGAVRHHTRHHRLLGAAVVQVQHVTVCSSVALDFIALHHPAQHGLVLLRCTLTCRPGDGWRVW